MSRTIRLAALFGFAIAVAPVRAEAAVIEIGLDSFLDISRFDFERFGAETELTDVYADLGFFFAGSGDPFRVRSYTAYGGGLTQVASDLGFGARGLEIRGNDQRIVFTDAPRRVGFFLGSNVDVHVPVLVLSAGAAPPEAFVLSVEADGFEFFGFEDPDGIAQIRFNEEIGFDFSSMVDDLRVELAPTGSVQRIGLDDFPEGATVLDFEEFEEEDLVSDQFAAQGVSFDGNENGWAVEAYDGYSQMLVDAAVAAGAGALALFHRNQDEVIRFDPPMSQVGFHFGSNVDLRVPITFHRGGAEIGSFAITAPENHLGFFGFEDPGGIEEVRFGTEQACQFPCVSQLDLVRFAPEPDGAATAIAAAGALLAVARRRRYTRSRSG